MTWKIKFHVVFSQSFIIISHSSLCCLTYGELKKIHLWYKPQKMLMLDGCSFCTIIEKTQFYEIIRLNFTQMFFPAAIFSLILIFLFFFQ